MGADRVGRGLMRAILGLMPQEVRREYAAEILELSLLRRARANGQLAALRLWGRELAAAMAATWAAWVDYGRPPGKRPPRRPRSVFDGLRQDLRFVVREIRRGSATPLLVMVTLAVGIGAVLAVLSMVDGLLLHPIPVPEPERVVRVFQTLNARSPFAGTSYPMLVDYRDATLLEGPAGWATLEAGFRARELSDRVSVGLVSGDFFDVLRVPPAIGRTLQPADDTPADPFVAVLSHALWTRVFRRDPDAVGATIEVSGTTFTVVGVAPETFHGASLETAPDLWAPFAAIRSVAASGLYAAPNILETRAFAWVSMVGRLHEGADEAAAQAELDRIAHAVRADLGESSALFEGQTIAHLRPLAEAAVAGNRDETVRFVALLGGIATLTLLIACLNSALLISARASTRELELSVRRALGAGQLRVLRQLLTENVLLAGAGAVAGVGLALLAARLLRSFSLPGGVPLSRIDMAVDARMAVAATALAMISAVTFGLWPSLVHSRSNIGARLRSAGRGVIGDVKGLAPLISLQAGLSLVLLIGALLFARTLVAALDTPLGFDAGGVAAISFAFQGHGYDNDEIPGAVRTILEAVEASPAVSAAAVASHVPLSPPTTRLRPIPEGAGDDWEGTGIALNTVSADYFRTLDIPLVSGRPFGPEDTPEGPDVAIVNRAAAAALFPDRDAIGGRFVLVRGLDPIEIVGIVEDSKAHSVDEDPPPYIYLPAPQNTGVGLATGTHLLARATSSAADALAVLRQQLRAFDPLLPTYDARLVETQMNRVLMPQRFGALLLGVLATVTLVVSAIGVYAAVSFGVRRRTREIGIRMALGAAPGRVMIESVTRTGFAVLAGVVIGIALAAGLARFVAAYLYGIDPIDAGAFGGAALTFVVVSVIAAWLPALRAARIDPDTAIREER